MSVREIFMMVFMLMGGLALFIFGMNISTEGLKKALGNSLQKLLSKTTKNRFSGIGVGALLGTVITSAPTVVMLMGFINAGLMTLEQAIAPIFGANIGTTLSMQLVSFKLNDYCFALIAVGLVISMIFASGKGKHLGRSLMGFGLLFLGITTMGQSIAPHRDIFAIYLRGINGSTLTGVLFGVAVSTLLTSIWQSSGATIAIAFAFIKVGIFTDISQVFPIVLGAHLGKCITTIMSMVGINIEARRASLSHLIFNVLAVGIAIIARPLFYYIIPMTSSDLIHQTANMFTLVMVVGSFILLPFTLQFARLVRFVVPSNQPKPEPSYLDYDLLEYPERAIVAVLAELQRVSKVCVRSLNLTGHMLLNVFNREQVSEIKMNEQIVDDIKMAAGEYLANMTKKYMSRRQIIMAQHLNRCVNDIERVGDHIDQLCDLSLKHNKLPEALVDKESFDRLFDLFTKASSIMGLVIESLNPQQINFQDTAMAILNARDEYISSSVEIMDNFSKKVENHEVSSIAAIYFNEYVSVLDRMIRHVKSIALAQKHEDFWIKQSKLDKKPKQLDKPTIYCIPDPTDYMDKLKTEDYL